MELLSILTVSAAIVAFIVVPGLLLSLAFFPGKKDLDVVERLGLSTVLGLTPVFLLYFLDKNLYVPINATTTLAAFAFVSLVGFAVWQARKG